MTVPDSRLFSTDPSTRLVGLQSQFASGTPEHAAIVAALIHIRELHARIRRVKEANKALETSIALRDVELERHETNAQTQTIKQLRDLADALESGGRICTENPCFG